MCDTPDPKDKDTILGSAAGAISTGLGPAGGMLGGAIGGYYEDAEDQWKEALGIGDDDGPPEASTLRAQIAREQWADYKERFQPIENVLLGYANNPQQYKQEAKDAALGRVGDVYNRAPEQIERRMTAYGLQVTPQDRGRIQQKTNYQRGLASVQAANMTDRLSEDQLKGIIGGGLFVGNRAATTNQRPQVGYGG